MFSPEPQTKGSQGNIPVYPRGLVGLQGAGFSQDTGIHPCDIYPPTLQPTLCHSCHDYNTSHSLKFCKSWRYVHYEAQVSLVISESLLIPNLVHFLLDLAISRQK